MTSDAVSAKIIRYRKLKQLSREKLARLLGVTHATIWRWEKCKRTPSPLAEEKLKAAGVI